MEFADSDLGFFSGLGFFEFASSYLVQEKGLVFFVCENFGAGSLLVPFLLCLGCNTLTSLVFFSCHLALHVCLLVFQGMKFVVLYYL